MIGQGLGQVREQRGAGRVADGVAEDARGFGDRLHEVRFSHSGLPHQNQIVVPLDEGAGGEIFDLDAVDGGLVELPVELGEWLAFGEAGFADAGGDAAFAALVGLFGDQPVQELLMRHAFAFGPGQNGVEGVRGQRHLECGEVGEDAVTQVGRNHRGVRRRRNRRDGGLAAGHDRSVPR